MSKTIYLIGHRVKEFSVTNYIDQPPRPADFYKIGIANDPERRVKTMRPGTPHALELVTTIEADNAKKVESLLHSLYSSWLQKGEWFKLMTNAVNSLTAFDRLEVQELEEVKQRRIRYGNDLDVSLYCEVMRVRNDE